MTNLLKNYMHEENFDNKLIINDMGLSNFQTNHYESRKRI